MAKKRTQTFDVVVNGVNRTGKAFKGVIGGMNRLKSAAFSMKTALVGAFSAIAVGATVKKSLGLFYEQERASRALADALASLGDSSMASLKDMEDFASGIQQVTTIGDEAVLKLAALGASMGELRGDQLKAATKAAIGLSHRLRIDSETAMRLIAKAAQGGTLDLGRYGIVVAKTATAQEKFNELLRVGGESFALAEGQAQTFGGRMTQFKNAIGDLGEALGKIVAPIIGKITGFLQSAAIPLAQRFLEGLAKIGNVFLQSIAPALEQFKGDVIAGFGGAGKATVDAFLFAIEKISEVVARLVLWFRRLTLQMQAFTLNTQQALKEVFMNDFSGLRATEEVLAGIEEQIKAIDHALTMVGKHKPLNKIIEDTGSPKLKTLIERDGEDIANNIKRALPRMETSRFMQGVSGASDPALLIAREQARRDNEAQRVRTGQFEELQKLGGLMRQFLQQKSGVLT